LNEYITSVQNSKVGPYDIDALRIGNKPKHQVDNMARNMGVTFAHLYAEQYEDSLAEDDWRKTLDEKMGLIEPGVAFKASIAEAVNDRNVAVDDSLAEAMPTAHQQGGKLDRKAENRGRCRDFGDDRV
jgi:hypothetical protein